MLKYLEYDHFEYVLAAYSVWVGVFTVYFFSLYRKSRLTRRALERYRATGSGDGNAP